MSSKYTTFFKINKKDEMYNIDLENIYTFLAVMSLIAHIVYEVFFIVYSKNIIAKYNIFSILFYILIIVFKRRISFNIFIILINIEVSLFATISIITIGFGYGFEMLFLILMSTNVFSIYSKPALKNIVIIVSAYLFFKLSYSQKFLWNFDQSIKTFYNLNFAIYFVIVNVVNYVVIKHLEKNNKFKLSKEKEKFSKEKEELSKEKEKYKRMITYDRLTGLANRASMEEYLNELCESYNNGNVDNVTVVFADIDNFKHINDTYGHPNGDIVLCTLGKVMEENIRSERDLVCRWGGEEFIIVMKNIKRGCGKNVIDKIRNKVSQQQFFFDGDNINVTMTFGVCSAYDSPIFAQDMIKMSDILLYEGKNSGKNRVIYKEI